MNRDLRSESGSKVGRRIARKIEVGELVLVAHDEALRKGGIWSAFQSILHGPCGIFVARNPRYEQVSSTGKSTRKTKNSRKLVRYHYRQNNVLYLSLVVSREGKGMEYRMVEAKVMSFLPFFSIFPF